ncbi:MAG: hypothetical protein JWN25_2223 [Verrucomicrobiales bacterium]|nr:hypothetical protein [Verrucomicrobiales bacterium]MDB6130109.1 hypothetical protein [Verrucomicrobiales bacterium]
MYNCMKKTFKTLLVLSAILAGAAFAPSAQAGFGLSFDFRDHGPYRHGPEFRGRFFLPPPPVVFCPPPRQVVVESVPIYTAPAPVVEQVPDAPYGVVLPSGNIRSPWSEAIVNVGGKYRGQVVYDVSNGRPFRIP